MFRKLNAKSRRAKTTFSDDDDEPVRHRAAAIQYETFKADDDFVVRKSRKVSRVTRTPTSSTATESKLEVLSRYGTVPAAAPISESSDDELADPDVVAVASALENMESRIDSLASARDGLTLGTMPEPRIQSPSRSVESLSTLLDAMNGFATVVRESKDSEHVWGPKISALEKRRASSLKASTDHLEWIRRDTAIRLEAIGLGPPVVMSPEERNSYLRIRGASYDRPDPYIDAVTLTRLRVAWRLPSDPTTFATTTDMQADFETLSRHANPLDLARVSEVIDRLRRAVPAADWNDLKVDEDDELRSLVSYQARLALLTVKPFATSLPQFGYLEPTVAEALVREIDGKIDEWLAAWDVTNASHAQWISSLPPRRNLPRIFEQALTRLCQGIDLLGPETPPETFWLISWRWIRALIAGSAIKDLDGFISEALRRWSTLFPRASDEMVPLLMLQLALFTRFARHFSLGDHYVVIRDAAAPFDSPWTQEVIVGLKNFQ